MAVSMLDQMLFPLECGHEVVLGRLSNLTKWVCESCGKETDLTKSPFRERLVQDLDTAVQIDLQEKERGETITRLG
jgi:hypothetical protein